MSISITISSLSLEKIVYTKLFTPSPIPTIEIELNESTSLDEMISLFVDINQYGVKVTRLQIVAALKRNDKLLKGVYDLVALKQKRRQDKFARRKDNSFVSVLKTLQVVSSIAQPNEQADRMWEKLFELALFVRSGGQHRKPTEILKSFIKAPQVVQPKLSSAELGRLTRVFEFLDGIYKTTPLRATPLATDQTHFYTMITTLLSTDVLAVNSESGAATPLLKFGNILDGATSGLSKKFLRILKSYRDLSAKQTTDVSRRESRQKLFIEMMGLLASGNSSESVATNGEI